MEATVASDEPGLSWLRNVLLPFKTHYHHSSSVLCSAEVIKQREKDALAANASPLKQPVRPDWGATKLPSRQVGYKRRWLIFWQTLSKDTSNWERLLYSRGCPGVETKQKKLQAATWRRQTDLRHEEEKICQNKFCSCWKTLSGVETIWNKSYTPKKVQHIYVESPCVPKMPRTLTQKH